MKYLFIICFSFSIIFSVAPLNSYAQDSCGFPINKFYFGIGLLSIPPNFFNAEKNIYINPHLRINQNELLSYNFEFGYFDQNSPYWTSGESRELTLLFYKLNPTFKISNGKYFMLELGPVFTYHNYYLSQINEFKDNLGQTIKYTDIKDFNTYAIAADIGVLFYAKRFMFRGNIQIGNMIEDKIPHSETYLPGYGFLINNAGTFIMANLTVYINLFYKKNCKALQELDYYYK